MFRIFCVCSIDLRTFLAPQNSRFDFIVEYEDQPVIQVTSSGNVCAGDNITLTATGGVSYFWDSIGHFCSLKTLKHSSVSLNTRTKNTQNTVGGTPKHSKNTSACLIKCTFCRKTLKTLVLLIKHQCLECFSAWVFKTLVFPFYRHAGEQTLWNENIKEAPLHSHPAKYHDQSDNNFNDCGITKYRQHPEGSPHNHSKRRYREAPPSLILPTTARDPCIIRNGVSFCVQGISGSESPSA